MACTIQRPDPQDAWDKISAQFSATVLGGAPVIPESNEFYAVSLEYALQEEFFAFGEQMWRERDPRYACCDNLTAMAGQRGFYPLPATFAQGYVQLTGIAGTPLNQNIRMQFGTQVFEPVSLVPDQLPSTGELVIRVSSVDPGPVGNVNVTTGQLLTPITGISSNVTAYGGIFCGGADAEDCEQFRSRYLERLQYRPRFTVEWLKQKAMEWPCVTDVCDLGPNCCPVEVIGDQVVCPNNIEFYVMFRDTFECGLAPQCVVDEITEWLFGQTQGLGMGEAEFGICGKIRTATAAKIDIFLNGLTCGTPQQSRVVQERIRDYIERLCPATNLTIEQLRFIGKQVLGPTAPFDVTIRPAGDVDQEGLSFNYCGDAIIDCDYKACLNEIFTPTTNVTASGCI
jgi:hypothetical protein